MRVGAISYLTSILKPARQTGRNGLEPDPLDGAMRGLFTRIKYSRLSRGQRDSMCSMVKSLAVDGRLGQKHIKSILQLIGLMESTRRLEKYREADGFPPEKTVDDEMDEVYSLRDFRQEQKDRAEKLQSSLSELV